MRGLLVVRCQMQLLDEIIDLLSSDNASTENALIKAQVLAHRLGDSELTQWVEHELRGYPDTAEIPSYRVVSVTLVGHITNGVYHYQNQTLPTGHLPEKLKRNLTRRELRQSISVLENWSKTENMGMSIPAEVLPAFSKSLSETYYVQQAWGRFGVGSILQVLTQIRSRLLEFCLKISDQFPPEMTAPQVREKAEEMGSKDVFRNAIFGDNTTIVVGDGSIGYVKNTIIKNDIESLVRHLDSLGVDSTDLEELKAAIVEDSGSASLEQKSLGPRVRGWIGTMVAKAGTASWQVSLEAAGNLLATAISKFYGFGT